AAADWLARLAAPDLTEADLETFDAWLAEPANAQAYDAALAVTLEYQAAAWAVLDGVSAKPARRPAATRGWLIAGGMAAAATIAIALVPTSLVAPQATAYDTAKGQHRTVTLAD